MFGVIFANNGTGGGGGRGLDRGECIPNLTGSGASYKTAPMGCLPMTMGRPPKAMGHPPNPRATQTSIGCGSVLVGCHLKLVDARPNPYSEDWTKNVLWKHSATLQRTTAATFLLRPP